MVAAGMLMSRAKASAYLVVVCAVMPIGCGGAPSVDASPAATSAARRPEGLLTGDEVRATRAANLFEAIRALRPRWLLGRGPMSVVPPRATPPVVYLQGIRHGNIATLRTMNTDLVLEVVYVEPTEAMTRYGLGHDGGVIAVRLDR